MKWCIKAAMNRWKCLTGVNFEIDTVLATDSTIDYDLDNTICLTKYDSVDQDIIVSTRTSFNTDPDSTINKPVLGIMSIDFEINKELKYWYDTTGTESRPPNTYDFFVTMLHEIGHALQLIHVVDSMDFMYYAEFNPLATLSPSQRRLNFNSYHKKAGDTTVFYSANQSLVNYSGLSLLPMIQLDTCNVRPLKINETNFTLDFKVYPNPSSTVINIELPEYGLKNISIYSIDGKLLKTTETSLQLCRFDISGFSKGIYIVRVSQNNYIGTRKFVCE
jgi:hypothetical protein